MTAEEKIDEISRRSDALVAQVAEELRAVDAKEKELRRAQLDWSTLSEKVTRSLLDREEAVANREKAIAEIREVSAQRKAKIATLERALETSVQAERELRGKVSVLNAEINRLEQVLAKALERRNTGEAVQA